MTVPKAQRLVLVFGLCLGPLDLEHGRVSIASRGGKDDRHERLRERGIEPQIPLARAPGHAGRQLAKPGAATFGVLEPFQRGGNLSVGSYQKTVVACGVSHRRSQATAVWAAAHLTALLKHSSQKGTPSWAADVMPAAIVAWSAFAGRVAGSGTSLNGGGGADAAAPHLGTGITAGSSANNTP